jgi:flagellar protein FliO/FliZ
VNELSAYLLQATLALVILAGLAWAAVWGLRRWSCTPLVGKGRLRLLESLNLGMGVRVVMLEAEGRRFLVGITPHAVSLLVQLPPAEEAAAESADGH